MTNATGQTMQGHIALNHMPQLDGLRAVAVGLVLLSHFGLGGAGGYLIERLDCGRIGVRLFFVLSGFLITRILLRHRFKVAGGTQGAGAALGQFYSRRALRIFPLFYLTVAVAWIYDCGEIRSVVGWHLAYLSNLNTALFSSLEGTGVLRDPGTAHFWSLAVEEQFYMLWPAVVLWCPRRWLLPGILGMIALAPLWRAAWYLQGYTCPVYHLPTCFDTLGMGALLALYRSNVYDVRQRIRPWIRRAVAAGGALLLATFSLRFLEIWDRPYVITVDTGLALLGLAAIHRAAEGRRDLAGRLLESAPMRYLGRISYGIYILHAFMHPLLDLLIGARWVPEVFAHGPLHAATLTAMSVLAASLSWRYLEGPLASLKDRIRFGNHNPATHPQAAPTPSGGVR